MDINDTVAPFKRDVRAKEAVNLKNGLEVGGNKLWPGRLNPCIYVVTLS